MIQSEVYFLLRQKEITEHRRITQTTAARESGVNPAALNRLMTAAQAEGVGKKTLHKLRIYLGIGGQTRFRLAEIMRERGMTQRDICGITGVSLSAINRIVNDNLNGYRFSVLDKLMRGLQLGHLEELLDTGRILAWTPDTEN